MMEQKNRTGVLDLLHNGHQRPTLWTCNGVSVVMSIVLMGRILLHTALFLSDVICDRDGAFNTNVTYVRAYFVFTSHQDFV